MNRWLLLVLLTFCSASALAETEQKPSITGMYSNLEYIAEADAGDVLGIEIYLVFGATEYFAVVQCAGGEPAAPVVTPVQVSGAEISFKLPAGQPECGTSFKGTVSKEGLRGRFLDEEEERWIPRRKGYWE